jgi:hypothetical protein
MHPSKVVELPCVVRVLRRTGKVLAAIFAFVFSG